MRSARPEPKALRVRHEPPTIDEAIAAARGMTTDRDQQVEIAADYVAITKPKVMSLLLVTTLGDHVRRGRLAPLG